MGKRPITEAKKKADAKYQAKFQQVKFYCEPDLYEEMKTFCEKQGESMASFMKRAIKRSMTLEKAQ